MSIRLTPRPKYISLALTALQQSVAYRYTTLLNLLANLVWVVVQYYLWQVVFAERPQIENYNWIHMSTYIVVAFAVNALLTFNSEARLFIKIESGEIVSELIQPINFLMAQLSLAVGAALSEGLISFTIAFLLGIFLLNITLPMSLFTFIFFLISVVLGFLVKFLISYMTALLCFWTLQSLGLQWARQAITNIFSGAIVPIQFFPSWLQRVALLSPFQSIIYIPISIYLGDITGKAIIIALIKQLAWIIALRILVSLLWIPCMKSLRIQGG